MKNAQLAHIWAQQKETSGKTKNMFFEGTSIYSYGYHFKLAEYVDRDTILVNSNGYSKTTAIHKSYVWRAIDSSSCAAIECKWSVRNGWQTPQEIFADRLEALRNDIAEVTAKHIRLGNSYLSADEWAERMADNTYRLFMDLTEDSLFRVWPELDNEENRAAIAAVYNEDAYNAMLDAKVAAYNAKHNNPAAIAKKAAERERRERKQREKELQAVALWKAGKTYWEIAVELGEKRSKDLFKDTYLRKNIRRKVSDDKILRDHEEYVETSQGAEVPVNAAYKLFSFINTGKAIPAGLSIGHFTFRSWDGEQLVIGCHTINKAEIYDFAQRMEWV